MSSLRNNRFFQCIDDIHDWHEYRNLAHPRNSNPAQCIGANLFSQCLLHFADTAYAGSRAGDGEAPVSGLFGDREFYLDDEFAFFQRGLEPAEEIVIGGNASVLGMQIDRV